MSRSGLAFGCALAALACEPAPPAAPAPAPPTAAPSLATAPVVAPSAAVSPLPPTPETLPEGTPTQLAALNRAKAALDIGHIKEALAEFRLATEGGMTGTSVSAALATAELLQAQGKDAEAALLFRELSSKARFIPEVQYTAGRFFWLHGDDPGAMRALEDAIIAQPDFLPAWHLLGLAQARAQRNTEAARTLAEYERRLLRVAGRASDSATPTGERLAALQLLSMLSDERAVKSLVAGLRDPDRSLRTAVALMLEDEPAPEALTALAEAALREKDTDVRIAMAESLAMARRRAQAETRTPLPALPKPEGTP